MSDLSWLTARPIAHRGLHDMNGAVWENTASAFSRAIARGFAIECDVHLTQDEGVVVFHDDSLVRLAGQDAFVWQRTVAEMGALRIGGTADAAPSLARTLELVAGRVPLVIELKGIAGHDAGLVEKVAGALAPYRGPVAIMSFDHWLLRDMARLAPKVPRGLTAWGSDIRLLEAHFAMLAHGIDFVSYDLAALPNPFVTFVRERLALPVISWTVRDQAGAERSRLYADQITFEGFDPDGPAVA